MAHYCVGHGHYSCAKLATACPTNWFECWELPGCGGRTDTEQRGEQRFFQRVSFTAALCRTWKASNCRHLKAAGRVLIDLHRLSLRSQSAALLYTAAHCVHSLLNECSLMQQSTEQPGLKWLSLLYWPNHHKSENQNTIPFWLQVWDTGPRLHHPGDRIISFLSCLFTERLLPFVSVIAEQRASVLIITLWGWTIHLILFSIMILASDDYENKIIEMKWLLCHVVLSSGSVSQFRDFLYKVRRDNALLLLLSQLYISLPCAFIHQ